MNAIPLINNIPKTNINNEKQLRQEINTSLVALKKEAGTLEGLINEAAQMLVTINNRIATLENDTVKKSDIVDVVQSGNLQPVTSNAVADKFINSNVIEQTAEKKITIILNGSASPDTATTMNIVLHFPFCTKNSNYSFTIKDVFIENIGKTTNPTVVNILKYESGVTLFISGFTNLVLYRAYNVRYATVEITFS